MRPMNNDDRHGQIMVGNVHRSSSTCSTESTISLTSSLVRPGMILSASVNACCNWLKTARASAVDTRGTSFKRDVNELFRIVEWTYRSNGR